MKSIIALILLVACAAQVQSACVNRNGLYQGTNYVSGYDGLGYYNYYNYGYGNALYPYGVLPYGTHYPRGCSCGKCGVCQSVTYPFNSFAPALP